MSQGRCECGAATVGPNEAHATWCPAALACQARDWVADEAPEAPAQIDLRFLQEHQFGRMPVMPGSQPLGPLPGSAPYGRRVDSASSGFSDTFTGKMLEEMQQHERFRQDRLRKQQEREGQEVIDRQFVSHTFGKIDALLIGDRPEQDQYGVVLEATRLTDDDYRLAGRNPGDGKLWRWEIEFPMRGAPGIATGVRFCVADLELWSIVFPEPRQLEPGETAHCGVDVAGVYAASCLANQGICTPDSAIAAAISGKKG